ncbi:hypothetical protein [Weissella cibaria]|uniref:hypothetical protein n=1 Tax=Weissella cibaria TaxID=137591 RepID=UPI003D359F86
MNTYQIEVAIFDQESFVAGLEDKVTILEQTALMSRLWTGFFGTARCCYPEKFSKPGFQPKMA